MPAGKCSMRKIREILRLRWGLGLTQRQTATSVRTSASTVFDTCARAKAGGLSWPLPAELDDAALEARLYPKPSGEARAEPGFVSVHRELRKKGVTLQLLWQEYSEAHDNPLGYVQFCNRYRAFRRGLSR